MAKFVRCPSGHVYDREANTACPKCGAVTSDAARPAEVQKAAASEPNVSSRIESEPQPGTDRKWLIIGGGTLVAVVAAAIIYLAVRPAPLSDPDAKDVVSDADTAACRKPSPDLAACDRAIASGRFAGTALGHLHRFRGFAIASAAKPDAAAARAEYTEAINLEPKDWAAYLLRSLTYSNAGDFASSVKDLDEAVKINPSAAVLRARGTSRRENGDVDGAIEDFNLAIKLDAKDFITYWNRGSAFNQKGQREAAAADFKQALALSPPAQNRKSIEQMLSDVSISTVETASRDPLYTGCASSSGDDIAACDKAIASGKFDGAALVALYSTRGTIKLNKQQRSDAVADYSEAIRLDPKNTYAFLNRGNAYLGLGDYSRAIADVDAAIKIGPPGSGPHLVRGYIYLAKEEFDKAVKEFDQSIELSPDEIRAYVGRGDAYRRNKDKPHAYADYQKALTLSPTPAMKRTLDGAIYLVKPDESAAAPQPADDNKALPDAKPAAEAETHEPVSNGSVRDVEAAERDKDFTQCRDAKVADVSLCATAIGTGKFGGPALSELYVRRGQMNYTNVDLDAAMKDFASASEADDKNPAPFSERGDVQVFRKNYEDAIREYDKAVDLDPKRSLSFEGRAFAYAMLEKKQQAIDDYKKALALGPTDSHRSAIEYSLHNLDPSVVETNHTDGPLGSKAAPPASENAAPQNGGSVSTDPGGVSKVTNADGSSVETREGGTRIVKTAKGGMMETRPDGTEIVTNPDGSSLETRKDGTKIVKTAKGASVEARPDGTQIITNEDGTSTTKNIDGGKTAPNGGSVSMAPGGVSKITNADGSSVEMLKDGTQIVHNGDGTSRTTKSDGTVITKLKDGSTVEKRKDGTVIVLDTGGGSVTKRADGSKTVLNAKGEGVETTADGKEYIVLGGKRYLTEPDKGDTYGKVLNDETSKKPEPPAGNLPKH